MRIIGPRSRYLLFKHPVLYWFQVTQVFKYENGTKSESIQMIWVITYTNLRTNAAYVHGYSLIGSTIIMVVIPGIILVGTFVMLHREIPHGNTRNRTMSIMGVIIVMFLICHIPKVKKVFCTRKYRKNSVN